MASVRLNNCTVSINNYQNQVFHQVNHIGPESASATQSEEEQPQLQQDVVDVQTVETSFFCMDRFSMDIIDKELASIFRLASSKADACRRLRQSESCGYITLSCYTNEKKAELINRYQTRFHFTGEDFKKA